MLSAFLILTVALTPFELTPFAQLGQDKDTVNFEATPFTKVSEHALFTGGALQTGGGTYLVFLRTNGSQDPAIRSIEFVSSAQPTFGVTANGSCEWLKKQLTLAYGAPSTTRDDPYPDSIIRKIAWQNAGRSVVVDYQETVSKKPLSVSSECGFTAKLVG